MLSAIYNLICADRDWIENHNTHPTSPSPWPPPGASSSPAWPHTEGSTVDSCLFSPRRKIYWTYCCSSRWHAQPARPPSSGGHLAVPRGFCHCSRPSGSWRRYAAVTRRETSFLPFLLNILPAMVSRVFVSLTFCLLSSVRGYNNCKETKLKSGWVEICQKCTTNIKQYVSGLVEIYQNGTTNI